MAESFGGIAFKVLVTGGQFPLPVAKANVNVRHIPGGNINYVDIGGLDIKRVNPNVTIASMSAYASLYALLGTTGTLIYDGVTYSGAIFSDIGSPMFYEGGSGMVTTTLEFLI